jgi:hypothetical protein
MKMERKLKILGILAAITIAISIFAPTFLVSRVGAVDPSSWYMNVAGVLATDTYALYPFKTDKSLTIGFSKFGEMIDSINNIGMEYRVRDPFAPAAGLAIPPEITKNKWFQGWLINITYFDGTNYRNVWAMAQHADKIDFGKDWIRVDKSYGYIGALNESLEDPSDQGKLISTLVGPINGGRKTNGTATTEDITVLYNGPRMFIARTVTHIFDWDLGWAEDEPLVDIVFTLIFNKDKKEVIVLKDIKETTTKYVFGPITVPVYVTGDVRGQQTWYNSTVNGAVVQFSNRGEWDLGPANTYDSYVHFYVANSTEARDTVYNWDEDMEHSYHLNPTLAPAPYLLGGISDWGTEPKAAGTYDVAQILASDREYVGWAAFWPSVSNWHVDGGYQNKWYKSLSQNESVTDSALEPFMSPYVIGEWDFVLTKTRYNATAAEGGYSQYWREFDRQFRGVTVYGVTDNWTGDDAKRTSGSNVLDAELLYQLEEVFNPWDLTQAVHKKTNSWVDFHTVTDEEEVAAEAGTALAFSLTNTPVWKATPWEEYCNSSEQVEWGGARKLPARSVRYTSSAPSANEPYELSVGAGCVGTITIRAASVPAADTVIKVLYSTWTTYDADYPLTITGHKHEDSDYAYYWANSTQTPWITAGWASNSTNPNATLAGTGQVSDTDCLDADHVFDMQYSADFKLPNVVSNSSVTLSGSLTWNVTDIKVFKEDTAYLQALKLGGSWDSDDWEAYVNNTDVASINLTKLAANWTITPPPGLDLHIDNAVITLAYSLSLTYWQNTTYYYWQTRSTYTVTASIQEHIPGRYEWVVVGNHSQSIDSIGAAMVSAAFKNKQVEIGNGGLDMKNMWGTNVPYLLDNKGSPTWRTYGAAWTTWYDSIGRLHLVDDWCTRYPVTTSNIISVAGPSANLMTEYWNEFVDAPVLYSVPSGRGVLSGIMAKTCWNTTKSSNYLGNTYSGNGYGVIATYKDINGTIGFIIWGYSGDDTYYISKWFHEEGIFYLQDENPGVTSIILQLDYTDHGAVTSNPMPPNYEYGAHNPEVTILERLGTISEKNPHDP